MLVGTLLWLLERRRALFAGAMVGLVALAGLRLIRGPEYRATSQFRPQGAGRSPLAGLAQQFGIDLSALGGVTEEESPFFYGRLLATGDILRRTALTTYRFPVGNRQADTLEGTVVDLYHISGGTRLQRDRRVQDFMRKKVFVGVDPRARLITVRTEARWPQLAVQMNRRLLDLMNEYNLKTRQSRAGAERGFVEQRLSEARADLEAAEGEFQRFQERNARYQESPELAFEAARLQRRVQFQQQIFTTLAQALEEARVDEVRDTPVITVVDSPEGSVREGAGPLGAAALGGALGMLVVLAVASVGDLMRRQRASHPAEYAALQRVARDTLGLLRRSRPLS